MVTKDLNIQIIYFSNEKKSNKTTISLTNQVFFYQNSRVNFDNSLCYIVSGIIPEKVLNSDDIYIKSSLRKPSKEIDDSLKLIKSEISFSIENISYTVNHNIPENLTIAGFRLLKDIKDENKAVVRFTIYLQ